MTLTQSQRLALIRADMAKWLAQVPAARNWDAVFLLNIIDEKNDRIKNLKKENS